MTGTLKVLVDAGVGKAVEEWLRQSGHDLAAVRDRDPHMEDDAILACAVQEQRAVVVGSPPGIAARPARESSHMHAKPLPTTEAPPSRNDIPLCTDDPLPPGLRPVPPGILRSLTAFRRDLPELMTTHYGQWVAYHGDERVGFGRPQTTLVQECLRRGFQRMEFVVIMVVPEIPYDEDGYL